MLKTKSMIHDQLCSLVYRIFLGRAFRGGQTGGRDTPTSRGLRKGNRDKNKRPRSPDGPKTSMINKKKLVGTCLDEGQRGA